MQSLTPDELRAVVGALRAGAELVKAMSSAGITNGPLAVHQTIRAGVTRMLAGQEMER